jgi:hypothetical protein
MHKRISPDRKEIGDAIHEVTKINPPEGLLWVDFCHSQQAEIEPGQPFGTGRSRPACDHSKVREQSSDLVQPHKTNEPTRADRLG